MDYKNIFYNDVKEKEVEYVEGIEPCYADALKFVIEADTASISMIQRRCKIGYNKAGQIVQWMEQNGFISEYDGAKSRKVFITMDEFEEKFIKKDFESYYVEALKFVVDSGCMSISILQRKLGFDIRKALNIIKWMEENAYISLKDDLNQRKILLTKEDFIKKFGS